LFDTVAKIENIFVFE